MSEPIRVKVIGCGVIGGALLPILCRYLNYSVEKFSDVEMHLIDGDSYEHQNAARQAFRATINKATETADTLAQEFPRIMFRARPGYVTRDTVVTLIREGDIIFSCVDNHASRLAISRRCEELDNVIHISGGNNYTDGSVQIHVRKNQKNLTRPVADPEYHPEIASPNDENPGEAVPKGDGCQAIVASAPQLLFANNTAASHMLWAFYAQVEGKLDYDEVVFDGMSNQARKFKRSPKKESA